MFRRWTGHEEQGRRAMKGWVFYGTLRCCRACRAALSRLPQAGLGVQLAGAGVCCKLDAAVRLAAVLQLGARAPPLGQPQPQLQGVGQHPHIPRIAGAGARLAAAVVHWGAVWRGLLGVHERLGICRAGAPLLLQLGATQAQQVGESKRGGSTAQLLRAAPDTQQAQAPAINSLTSRALHKPDVPKENRRPVVRHQRCKGKATPPDTLIH